MHCILCYSRKISYEEESHNIAKCAKCGLVFDNPAPRWEDIIAFYSKKNHYHQWEDRDKGMLSSAKRHLKMLRKHKKYGLILEIGPGVSPFLSIAKRYFSVVGVDISARAEEVQKTRYDTTIVRRELKDIDFIYKYDVIYMYHVLEHSPEPLELIRKCYDLLNKTGILVIAVPNEIYGLRFLAVRLLTILGVNRFKNYGRLGLPKLTLDGSLAEIHLSHFKDKVLVKALKGNGFKILENTLDPLYVAEGFRECLHYALYLFCLIVYKVSRRNIYPAIWVVAKKEV